GERKLNIVHRRGKYSLQVPNDASLDLTSALGDLAWLTPDAPPATRPLVDEDVRDAAGPGVGELDLVIAAEGRVPSHFFAHVKGGRLEPIDPTGLPEGAVVKVRATIVLSIPQTSALRQTVAAGGPADLPK